MTTTWNFAVSWKQKNKKTPEPCPGKPSSIVSPSAHKSRKMTRFLDYMPQTNFTSHSKTTKNVTRKFIPLTHNEKKKHL